MTLLVNVIKFYFNYHCYIDYLDLYAFNLVIGKLNEVIEGWNVYEI